MFSSKPLYLRRYGVQSGDLADGEETMYRERGIRFRMRAMAVIPVLLTGASAQSWDPGSWAVNGVKENTGDKLNFTLEQRVRYESRTGSSFGNGVDVETGLVRTRLGLTYKPVEWIKFSGMVQDSRAPWYGANAPNAVRDQADLQEGYVELFPATKSGFGLTAGRMMLNYGEGRLIGTPQWGNLSRTYDHTRAYWRTEHAQLEVLFVSPVKVRIGEFNRPELGDHIWGTYDVFPDLIHKSKVEAYALRRDQNQPGGFVGGSASAGTDKLGIDTFGFLVSGPVAGNVKYSIESAWERGKVGPADLSGRAWYSSLSRRWMVSGKTLDVTADYKYASGTDNPSDVLHTGTFNQLYAANHNVFGHQDLFAWQNLHTVRGVVSYSLFKNFTLSCMYFDFRLASARDGLYGASGKQIARSAAGTAGTHVGQEADLFGTYKYGHFTFGAGYGHFFTGQFVNKTTPGVGPAYLYLFHTYTL